MALSEREQQVLRDLESQLHQDDPDLAQTLQREERRLSRPSPRHIGGGVALVLIGLALLIAGVSVRHNLVSILLGVAGFLVAVAGVAMALTRVESGSSSRQSSADMAGGGTREPTLLALKRLRQVGVVRVELRFQVPQDLLLSL